MQELKLTKRTIKAIPYTSTGQEFYRDALLPGFGLRVGAKTKTFYADKRVNKKTCRVSLGRVELMGLDEARRKALSYLSDMADNIAPNKQKKKSAAEQITMEKAFEKFFETRTHLSPVTVHGYTRTVDLYLKVWRKKPLNEIERQMVLKKHKDIAGKHGEVSANNAMRHLRSVYNFTAATQDDLPPNPVLILTQARAWYREKRRRTVIPSHSLGKWWDAVLQEPEYARDFLFLALFTGMRRGELMRLRWENIDLIGNTLHLPETKNGDPLDLPLSGFLVDLFSERHKHAASSEWVFPGTGEGGHFVEVKRALKRVRETSGVAFTTHDLRRTYITIAESLDVPYYALKRMLNHRSAGDVTGGYIVIDAERLRGPVEQVAQKILELVGQTA
ncbi:MAG: hypothetical protein COA62_12725 [Rhodobiaceae bacterium]|nr:MAG: hypothetical protein COA62_12725 [Rhodobiaceae bacterium]